MLWFYRNLATSDIIKGTVYCYRKRCHDLYYSFSFSNLNSNSNLLHTLLVPDMGSLKSANVSRHCRQSVESECRCSSLDNLKTNTFREFHVTRNEPTQLFYFNNLKSYKKFNAGTCSHNSNNVHDFRSRTYISLCLFYFNNEIK